MQNVREKLIIENELKFEVDTPQKFRAIYEYLDEKYDLVPYRNALMYDYYYDTPDLDLRKAGISYRIRLRPQLSINLKLAERRTKYIWSRYEYSFKTDSQIIRLEDIFQIDCDIHRLLKDKLGIYVEKQMNPIGTIQSYRMGFNVRYKEKNALGNSELLGVAFFDTSKGSSENKRKFYEFEMETYEQTDVFASPYIFNDLQNIGDYLKKELELQESATSKIERILLSNRQA